MIATKRRAAGRLRPAGILLAVSAAVAASTFTASASAGAATPTPTTAAQAPAASPATPAASPATPAAPATAPAPGASPETHATATPIKHYVMAMQGGRSFDNYFGTYPGADGLPANTCQSIPVAPVSDSCVKPFPLHGQNPGFLGASSQQLRTQWNNGKMDSFVSAYSRQGRDGRLVMGYYDQRDIPVAWSAADQYELFDQWFSSSNDGERANRSFWVSGALPATTSGVAGYNDAATIFDRLQAAGVSWKFYVQNYDPAATYRSATAASPVAQTSRVPLLNYGRFVNDPALASHIVDLSQYYRDLGAGTLPAVSYISSSGTDERAARSVDSGQLLMRNLVTQLMSSSAWDSSAFVWTYDGSGGWYDHVAPPVIDGTAAGMRVPAMLISPYVKPGTINHTVLDYTSALAFVEHNWAVAPLTARDGGAAPLTGAFDFASPPRAPRLLAAEAKADAAASVTPPRRSAVPLLIMTYGPAIGIAVLILLSAVLIDHRRRPIRHEAWSPGRRRPFRRGRPFGRGLPFGRGRVRRGGSLRRLWNRIDRRDRSCGG